MKPLLFFLAALPFGSLVEYLLHRFVIHARVSNGITRRHKMHHKSNQADSLWGDFRDFSPGFLPFCWLGFLAGRSAGVAFLLGTVFYAFVVALIHKLSHEHPNWIFWMSPDVHSIHHQQSPRANYGIVTHFWDLVFGTYQPAKPIVKPRPVLDVKST